MKPENYEVKIRWSAEDDTYIAEVPDLPGCMVDGKTPLEVLKAAHKAIKLWLDTAKKEGRLAPTPPRLVIDTLKGEYKVQRNPARPDEEQVETLVYHALVTMEQGLSDMFPGQQHVVNRVIDQYRTANKA